MPGRPYNFVVLKLNRFRVMMPVRPKSMIAERERTKGGETTGSTETILNRPLTNLFPTLTYMSTYAKRKPTRVARMPEIKPSCSVFEIAFRKPDIPKMRANTESVI